MKCRIEVCSGLGLAAGSAFTCYMASPTASVVVLAHLWLSLVLLVWDYIIQPRQTLISVRNAFECSLSHLLLRNLVYASVFPPTSVDTTTLAQHLRWTLPLIQFSPTKLMSIGLVPFHFKKEKSFFLIRDSVCVLIIFSIN